MGDAVAPAGNHVGVGRAGRATVPGGSGSGGGRVCQAAAEAVGSDRVVRSRAMLFDYFQKMKDEPNLARLLLTDIRGISPQVDRAIDDALRASSDDMTRALAKPGQQFDEMLQAGILGGVIHIALHWMARGCDVPVEQVTETALKLGVALLD